MSLPKIDICVLVHNQLAVTKMFVQHLFNNTKSDFNLIFLDNGSDTETKKYLSDGFNNKQWKLISFEKNLGVIKGRNILYQNVESDYFVNIDNDQYVHQGWIENLFSYIENGYDICGCEAWLLSPPKSNKTIILNGKNVNSDYFPIKKIQNSNEFYSYIGCGGMLLKRSVPDKIGLFDELFNPAYFEDPDFSFRCLKNGYKIAWSKECKITHLAHQTFNNQNLFNRNQQFITSWNNFKNKWNDYYPLTKMNQ